MAEIFTWTPNHGGNVSVEPRLRRVQFGDGYSQVAPDGLNHMPRKLSLEWIRPEAEAGQIVAFFERHGGASSFAFTHSGRPGLWRTSGAWTVTDTGCRVRTISATFEEVFA